MPIFALFERTAPSLSLAKGPTSAFFAIDEFSIEQKSLTTVSSPIFVLNKTVFEPIDTLLPSMTSPFMVTLLPIFTSRPTFSGPST